MIGKTTQSQNRPLIFLISSYISEATGGSSLAGWFGGMIGGAFSGVGTCLAGNLLLNATKTVGVACLKTLAKSLTVAFGTGFLGGTLAQTTASIIDKNPIIPQDVAFSGICSGLVTCIGSWGSGCGSVFLDMYPLTCSSFGLANTLNTICTVATEFFCDALSTIMSWFS